MQQKVKASIEWQQTGHLSWLFGAIQHKKYIAQINGHLVTKETSINDDEEDTGYYIEHDPTEYKTEQDLMDALGNTEK